MTNIRPAPERSTLIDRLLTLPQYLLPQHTLSKFVHRMTRVRHPLVSELLIRTFVRHYDVDLGEAVLSDPAAYPSFNAFFTRQLHENARPLPGEPDAIACPVDGKVSQVGALHGSTLIQAKARTYSVQSLLGGRADLAAGFEDGLFATLYLAPRNYHRIHMPLGGTPTEVIYVPGALFSVNDRTTRVVDRLFARNERVISMFDTRAGRVALIMVGAMCVGSMELTACDISALAHRRTGRAPFAMPIGPRAETLQRGGEMGRFNMGSTVILLLPRDAGCWKTDLAPGDPVRMGQKIGTLNSRLRADTAASR